MGGKIVKIAKGNYTEKARNINYYSGGDINTIAGKRINEKAGEGIFFGDAEEAPQSNLSRTLPITIECYIEFRPKPDWRGEFGFDWFRNGDYKNSAGLFNNLDYKDIISKQYTDSRHRTLETDPNKFKGYFKKNIALYNSLKNKFKPTKIKWKHKKDSSGNTLNDASGNPVMDEFLASYLTIFKKETDPDVSVTIQAYIHVKTEPEELKIKLEESQKEFFSVTPVDLTKTVTNSTPTKQDITITCKKTCSTDQVINIVAVSKGVSPHFCGDPEHEAENQITKEEIVGKLIVKANDKPHRKTKKIVFVEMKTNITSSGPNKGNANISTDIKKYLRQALIDVDKNSATETLDLISSSFFNSRFVKNGEIEGKGSLMGSLEYLFKDMLKKRTPSEEHKYDDFFKVFIFDEKGYHPDPNTSKAGFAFPGENYTILFRDANAQTGAHEILHALNLAHTFTNSEADSNAKWTFTYKSINNILSYSHHKAITNSAYKTARFSLQHWQWAIANAAADPE
ncbi:hypothetical protein [Aquimarina muelleri]|uniref:Uncharacterized protein n=1 Tax=Aquimarina muelleri TaxID=279356 RepID=A0A918JUK6_9FLAO|nr:hypothetical protein [Aquimarina muelleri]MCX2764622.1 hypothetical protein [Aquimarina muelleri]GGX19172.1 hypothetical protein GCM10007384_20640 [Aquimarina muelleri]